MAIMLRELRNLFVYALLQKFEIGITLHKLNGIKFVFVMSTSSSPGLNFTTFSNKCIGMVLKKIYYIFPQSNIFFLFYI